MSFNRFELKIMAALVVAATMPLIGALVLGRGVLREVYEVGVNTRVGRELERGLGLYRDHFVTLRKEASEVTTAIGEDWGLREALASTDRARIEQRLHALLTLYTDVTRVSVRLGGESLAEVSDDKRVAGQRLLQIERMLELPSGPAVLSVTVAAPIEPFVAYQRAGELAADYRRLQRGTGQLAALYLVVYMGFLLSVIVVALAVGIVLSRRVTRRVSLLADATHRVGAGDLDVQIPTDVNDEIGELTRDFNAMVRDIRESRDRIEYLQRIGAWQEFARRLAHEIKNPLTPIQLVIQELERSYRGDDAAFSKRLSDARSIIEEEVAVLRRLTAEFSAFARLPEATLTQADLNDFLRDASRSFEAAVSESVPEQAAPQIQLELTDQALPVRIDAMMLKRCLDNLIRNAAQALEGHAGPRIIMVRSLCIGERAVLQVHDSGPGVPARDRAHVFDPYFTTKSDGTGLGLAIVKKVVLEHAGEIECGKSELGGAEFSIELPLSS
jgi:two-component system, NtrC family, nitrogen regulation sensor histidine kinase NtrY